MLSVYVSFSVASQEVEEEVMEVVEMEEEEDEGRNNPALITFMAPSTQ